MSDHSWTGFSKFVNAPSTANGQKEDNDSESDDGESIRPDEEAGIFAYDDIEDDYTSAKVKA